MRRSCLSRNETERAGHPTKLTTRLYFFRGSLSASDFKLKNPLADIVLNLLPAFYLLGREFLVQMFYKQMLCTSCTCSGQNGTTGGGGGGGLVSNGHTMSSLIARPCLTLSTRLKQQKRTAFKGNYNYFFTIRKFALYVSYAQINQPFIKIIFYIIQIYTTRV